MLFDSLVTRPFVQALRPLVGRRHHAVAAKAAAVCAGLAAAPCLADIPNNSCGNAAPIGLGTTLAPNADASPNDFNQVACGSFTRPAWYSFTVPASGDLTIAASPQNAISTVVLATGPSCTAGLLNCSVGGVASPAIIVLKGLAPGQTVKIVVGIEDGDDATNVELTLAGIQDSCGTATEGLTCCLGGNWRGCNDPECCASTCSIDPYCCDSAWDATCSNRARELCGSCNYPDCDGNGVSDSVEFGANRSMLLPTDHFYGTGGKGSAQAFCPQIAPSAYTGMVITGRLQQGGSRNLIICSAAVFRSMDIVDTDALMQTCGDGITSVDLAGADGLRIAASGSLQPARLQVRGLTVTTPRLTLGRPDSEGTLELAESTLFADEVELDHGTLQLGIPSIEGSGDDGRLVAGSAVIGADARLTLSPLGSAEFTKSLVVRGLLDMAPDSSVEGQITGPLPSSWIRTAGSIQGNLTWGGCIRPKGLCEVAGDLTLVATETGPSSRYLWDASQGDDRLLTVWGTAKLAGTLFIDARNTPVGSSSTILRASTIEGAFDSVQVFGLPPQFALIVAPVQGGALTELRARIVTVDQLLGFGEGSNIPLELTPQDSVTADFDSDGIDDLAVSLSAGPTNLGAVTIFRGTGKGLVQILQQTAGVDPRGIAASDFDSDGLVDLVVALAGDDAVRVLRNTTASTIAFNPLAPVPVGDAPVDVATLDFFPDAASLAGGGKDVLVAVAGDSTFVALKNSGGSISNSGSTTTPSPGGIPTSVGGGDVDNDRVDDGVGGTTGGSTIIPGGSGAFADGGPIFLPSPHPVTSVTLADFNDDGVLDIVSTLDATAPRATPPGTPEVFDTLSLIEYRPAGFASTLFDYRYTARSIAQGDFDADGDQDLAFASRETANGPLELRIVRNDMSPQGALLTRQNAPAIDVEPRVVGTISIDGNGADVLAFGPGTSDSNSNLFLQRFLEPAIFGDLNGDGVVDASDLGNLLLNWGEPGPTDLDGNGATDAVDLGLLLDRWSGV